MTTRSTTNNKLDKLYAELSPIERVRMQAKLSKAHDTAGMDRLRRATPAEHAEAYNRALGLLRMLNGHALNWIAIFHIGMERDRMRLQHAISEAARQRIAIHSLYDLWKLIPYPVTESEYRAVIAVERAELEPLEEYASFLWEYVYDDSIPTDIRPELAAIMREYRDGMEEAEQDALWDRFYACFTDAIKRGELPKPKRKPKRAKLDTDDGIWLPRGALSDWARGTTEATYKPYGPGLNIPFLDELFSGGSAEWDIRPDSEADTVKARRARILDAFLTVRAVPIEERERLPSLDPPLTPKEREQAETLARELLEDWNPARSLAAFALEVAQTHATHRAQLEDLLEAIEIIRRDDFGGEDPIWTEQRGILERVQAEARRFEETWASAHDIMRTELREAAGLEGFPRDTWNPETKTHDIPPVPLPEGDHDLEGTLKLIYDWAR